MTNKLKERLEMIAIYKLLEEAKMNLERTPSVSAPSGEWEEYNVHHLECLSEVEVIEDIIKSIGSCSQCKFGDPTKTEDLVRVVRCSGLSKQIILMKPTDYCSKFERKE